MIDSGGREKDGESRRAKILLLFRRYAIRRNDGQSYAFLQYMNVTCIINMVDKTVGLYCSRRSIDGTHRRLRNSSGALKKGGLRVMEGLAS